MIRRLWTRLTAGFDRLTLNPSLGHQPYDPDGDDPAAVWRDVEQELARQTREQDPPTEPIHVEDATLHAQMAELEARNTDLAAEVEQLRKELDARPRGIHLQPRPSFTRKPAPPALPASPCDGRRETCLRLHETLHALDDRLALAEGRRVQGGVR